MSTPQVKIFNILTTPANGVETSDQTLVYNAGQCSFWLDPSDATCLTNSGDAQHINGIYEKTVSAYFTYSNADNVGSSTPEEATVDSVSLIKPAFVLNNGYISTSGDPINAAAAPLPLDASSGQFSFFYAGSLNYNPAQQQQSWLFNSNTNSAGHYTPSTTCIGGLLLTLNIDNTVQLTIYDAGGLSISTPAFRPVDPKFYLTFIVTLNASGHPVMTLRVNGQVVWSFDAGPINATGYNFTGIGLTSIGCTTKDQGAVAATGEVIAYSGVLTASSVSSVETYLQQKWQPVYVPISFGTLSTNKAVAQKTFTATISISGATQVNLSTTALNVGSNWTATPPVSGSDIWTITGTMPSSVTAFILHMSALGTGGTNATQSFTLYSTPQGGMTAEQNLIYGPQPALWLDPSDTSCLTIDSSTGKLSYIVDKTHTWGFNISSSETPIQDQISFAVSGISFAKSSESSSGHNVAISLDFTTDPTLHVVDPTIFTNNTGNLDLSQQPKGNGVVFTDSQGQYTVFMIGRYNGKQSGTEAANLTISNDLPVGGGGYYPLQLGVSTTNQTTVPLFAFGNDANSPPDTQTANIEIDANAAYLVTWRYNATNSTEEIRINGVTSSLTSTGSSAWASLQQKISQLSGAHSPGSVGSIIAYASALDDATTASIEQYLQNKWFLHQANAPTISTPSNLKQYTDRVFTASTIITNGTANPATVSISASAGSNWQITADPIVISQWNISGLMPDTAGPVTITITATQSGATTNSQFTLTAVALPTAPVIGVLAPTNALMSTAYTGSVSIQNVNGSNTVPGVTVTATAGSNWQIKADPLSSNGTGYIVTGLMPGVATTFNLTITAEDVSPDGLVASASHSTFVMQALSSETILPTPYPLDLTGLLPSNLIVKETQTLTLDNGSNGQFFIPALAPFFGNGFVLIYEDQNGALVPAKPGIDYQFVCELISVSRACAFPVYTAISVMNRAIQNTVHCSYQTLGGNFALNKQAIFQQLIEKIVNQREVDWSHLINLPTFFPAAPHAHQTDSDLVGLTPLVNAINDIATNYVKASQTGDSAGMSAHIANTNNPHNVSKSQIGLGLVPNYPPATDAQAVDASNTSTLLTPRTAALAAAGTVSIASATQAGITSLNEGNATGDDNNATDALTAAGLLALMTSPSDNAIKTTFSSGDGKAFITPYPMSFPLYWQGIKYNNLNDFISAVETYMGVEPLFFDQVNGCFIIPRGLALPNLQTFASSTSTSSRNQTTQDPVTSPIVIPT